MLAFHILDRRCVPKSSTSKPYKIIGNSKNNNNKKKAHNTIATRRLASNNNIAKALRKRFLE